MKILLFAICFIFSGLVLKPSLAHADGTDESLREFEAEVERVDMQEIYGQTQGAEDEAQHQEQLQRQHKQDLKELQAKKANLGRKARVQIADANYRRMKAEKETVVYEAEIKHLKKQVTALEHSISIAQARADEAEGLAAEERDELNEYRQERRALLNRKEHKRAPAAARKSKDDDLEAYHQATSSADEF
jgi:hypothetical protein